MSRDVFTIPCFFTRKKTLPLYVKIQENLALLLHPFLRHLNNLSYNIKVVS